MKKFKEEIKEILTGVFEPFTIIMIIGVFISGLIVFTLVVGDPFLVALKDSFGIAVGMAIIVLFGAYVKHLEKKE